MNELQILAAVTLVTGLMWVPYILERIYRQGLTATVGYSKEQTTVAGWALRAQLAHRNAVENLVVFGVLLVSAQFVDRLGPVTLWAAQLYLVARVIHYLSYLFAVPWVRTIAFVAGFLAQFMLAWVILMQG